MAVWHHKAYNMAASMTAILTYSNNHNFLISRPILNSCIKINGLLSTLLQDLLTTYIAFPFKLKCNKGKVCLLDYFSAYIISLTCQKLISQIRESNCRRQDFLKYKLFLCWFKFKLDGSQSNWFITLSHFRGSVLFVQTTGLDKWL